MSAFVDFCEAVVEVFTGPPSVTVEALPPVEVTVEGPPLVVVVEAGVQGRDGADGSGGASQSTYTYYQAQPSATWNIAHGLGRYPSVTLVDTSSSVMDAYTTYADANTVVVQFTAPVAGHAYLN